MGPASAYPTFRTPASTCFIEANDVLVPGLTDGRLASVAVLALVTAVTPIWAAARVIAAVPKKCRRSRSIGSRIGIRRSHVRVVKACGSLSGARARGSSLLVRVENMVLRLHFYVAGVSAV